MSNNNLLTSGLEIKFEQPFTDFIFFHFTVILFGVIFTKLEMDVACKRIISFPTYALVSFPE